jgi:hypothetical protein
MLHYGLVPPYVLIAQCGNPTLSRVDYGNSHSVSQAELFDETTDS